MEMSSMTLPPQALVYHGTLSARVCVFKACMCVCLFSACLTISEFLLRSQRIPVLLNSPALRLHHPPPLHCPRQL